MQFELFHVHVFGFNLYLAKSNIELSLGTTHYEFGYVLNGFIVIGIDNY